MRTFDPRALRLYVLTSGPSCSAADIATWRWARSRAAPRRSSSAPRSSTTTRSSASRRSSATRCHAAGVAFFVNDRPEVAVAAGRRRGARRPAGRPDHGAPATRARIVAARHQRRGRHAGARRRRRRAPTTSASPCGPPPRSPRSSRPRAADARRGRGARRAGRGDRRHRRPRTPATCWTRARGGGSDLGGGAPRPIRRRHRASCAPRCIPATSPRDQPTPGDRSRRGDQGSAGGRAAPGVERPPPRCSSGSSCARLGAADPDVLVGPQHGVDVGVVQVADGVAMALTTDPVFVVPAYGWERAAWFAVHILASDAATSGLPLRWMAVDLNLPPEISDDELSRRCGTRSIARASDLGIAVVTGHTARYDGCAWPMVGGATCIALGPADAYVTPAMARPGRSRRRDEGRGDRGHGAVRRHVSRPARGGRWRRRREGSRRAVRSR